MLTLLPHERTWLDRYRAAIREECPDAVRDPLQPLNPDFEPILLTGADGAELQVVAELVEVLEPGAFSTETHSR